MAELCRISTEGEVLERWAIGTAALVVGRDALADAWVNDLNLSRQHFVVARSGESFVIRDLGSVNGTWMNGERVTETRLEPNAWICCGQSLFVLRLRSQPLQWVVQPGSLVAGRGVEPQAPRTSAA